MEGRIEGGAFQVARKIFESELWMNKPSSWKVIWIYILGRVNHKKDSVGERGEGFFQWTKELSRIGDDITYDNIKKSSSYFAKNAMISTRRSTRGVHIKVLNYNKYQGLDNYSSTNVGTKKALRKHLESTTIDKNDNNVKNDNNSDVPSQDIVSIIDSFKPVNPSYQRWFGNVTQRSAIERLLKVHGKDLVAQVIGYLPKSNSMAYVPTITTPLQLEEKWASLQSALLKKKGELQEKKAKIAFI